MAAAAPCKYRAFLSYSHRDTAAAKRLHGRLEGFRIDKDLVGRETPMGPIPKHLRSIFRDRHDFDAGGTLAVQTVAALDSSAALILVASPAAASSSPPRRLRSGANTTERIASRCMKYLISSHRRNGWRSPSVG